MRTALELEAETAEKLRALARERNVSVEELLSVYVPGLAFGHTDKNGSASEDETQAFDEWVASFTIDAPPLSDEAVDRASIYRDRRWRIFSIPTSFFESLSQIMPCTRKRESLSVHCFGKKRSSTSFPKSYSSFGLLPQGQSPTTGLACRLKM
ncbi:MAG: hypothetical protein ABI651_18835 [Verrucomicrobiota bacterium]